VDSLGLADSSRNPVLLFPRAGAFWVKYSATNDSTGCAVVDSGLVIVRSPLTLLAAVFADSCGNGQGSVELSASGSTGRFLYALNDTTRWQSNPKFKNLKGLQTYTFFVRDSAGCWLKTDIFIRGRTPLSIQAGADVSISLGDSLRRRAVANFTIKTIRWQPIERGIHSPTTLETVLYPLQTTNYIVLATDSTGCEAQDSFRITVIPKKIVALADAFSPNNDGKNDYFFPQATKDVTLIHSFRVFNRWGKLVFERFDFPANMPELGWDGTLNEQNQQPDVYVWVLEAVYLDGEMSIESLKGSVQLVR
jgi:gliding motility-associated-like protein